jgi:adenylate cyclase
MPPEDETTAWLETGGQENISVQGYCTFGRTPGNTVVLPTSKISRRHALIHEQGGEFWLVDLGSTNGVLVNGTRVVHPAQLRTADRIQMADCLFTFRQTNQPEPEPQPRRAPPLKKQNRRTVADIKLVPCWILRADLLGFTQLSVRMCPEELAPLVGTWTAHCQEILQSRNGILGKFLGDGFLAYWIARDDSPSTIAAACKEFRALQKNARLPFRMILHYGMVSLGGRSPDASGAMFGADVNFTFRLEKVGSRLKLPWIVSDAAAAQIQGYLALTPCGAHSIPDFGDNLPCFTLSA